MSENCPECVSGKHVNCDGSAWSEELDGIVPCLCALNDHQEVS